MYSRFAANVDRRTVRQFTQHRFLLEVLPPFRIVLVSGHLLVVVLGHVTAILFDLPDSVPVSSRPYVRAKTNFQHVSQAFCHLTPAHRNVVHGVRHRVALVNGHGSRVVVPGVQHQPGSLAVTVQRQRRIRYQRRTGDVQRFKHDLCCV